MLDEELDRRKPVEGTQRQVVGTAEMGSKLHVKVSQGEKGTGGIETFLVFAVTALYFSIMAIFHIST